MHENLSRKSDVKIGSERAFGFVFAVVFVLIGLWPLLYANSPRWWALGIALGFLLVALIYPKVLRPLNRLWFLFGLLLHSVVNPLVMGLLFYTTVTPTGLLMRAMGKDPLRLKIDPASKTYWIHRDPPGPTAESLKNQF